MKGTMCLSSTLFTLSVVAMCIYLYYVPSYRVETNICKVVPDDIKAAIYIMGPGYKYRLHPDGKLEVCLDGKWMNLNY